MNINVAILLFAVKKDTAVEMAKKREQERQRLEKLAETSRVSRYQRRSRSRSNSQSPRFFSSSISYSSEFQFIYTLPSVWLLSADVFVLNPIVVVFSLWYKLFTSSDIIICFLGSV